MAIFPSVKTEMFVQVNDKTRLDASNSFISKSEPAITAIKIQPDASEAFVDITAALAKDWWLDWEYSTDGTKTVVVEITTDGAPVTKSAEILVLSEQDDNLFSKDQDLIEYESDIIKYVRPGRSSWLDFHRKAQELIVSFFDERGNVDASGNKITKAAFITDEVKEWSTVLTLRLIYEHLSTQGGEQFKNKAKEYKSQELERRNRVVTRLDLDGDSVVSLGEYLGPTSVRIYRA